MRVFIPVLAAGMLLSPAYADTGGRPAAKLSKMFPMLDAYQEMPESERSNFEMEYVVLAEDPANAGFELWIEPDGKRVDIERTAGGRVNTAALLPYIDSDPMVMTTLPKGGGSVNMTASPKLDLARSEIPVSEVDKAISQADRAMKKRAGLFAFAAPKVKSVRFRLAPGVTAGLRSADGSLEALPATENWVVVRPAKANMDGVIIFSEPPLDDAFSD